MMFILLALFFWWLVYREVSYTFDPSSSQKIYFPYLISVLVLALGCSWPPVHHWYFQRFLSKIAIQLADHHPATVHCNTLFDTLFDEDIGVAGHADVATGYIVIQYPRCSILMDYVAHPERAGREIISLNVLTHESMHARGEHDEAKTECAAVQRNYRTAKLLGVPDSIAKKNALDYYNNYYSQRPNSNYFSKECAPGKELDEHLVDSTWAQ